MTSNLDTNFYVEKTSQVPDQHVVYIDSDTSANEGSWISRSFKVVTGKLDDWCGGDSINPDKFQAWLISESAKERVTPDFTEGSHYNFVNLLTSESLMSSEEAKKCGLIDDTSILDAFSRAFSTMAKNVK